MLLLRKELLKGVDEVMMLDDGMGWGRVMGLWTTGLYNLCTIDTSGSQCRGVI